MLLLGANEAGKGSVVGSMFEAGLFVEEDRLFDLAGWGGQGLQAALASKEGEPGQEDSLHCLGSVHPGSKTQVIDELRAVMTRDNIPISLDLQPFRQAAV